MNKIYQRIDWENYPSSATPLNEDNLNKMDYAIDKLDDRIVTHETTKLNTATGNTLVKNVTFDERTGVFTIEKLNGSKITINTALEKISTNFHFNPTTQKLILTLIDGTTQEIDLSALLTQYEFLESDTITFTIDASGKVKANILNGSITGEKLEPNYLANVTLQANNAKTSADNAKTSEQLAYQYAEEAKESASQTAKSDAKNITYDNTESGLSATNVKDALDEVAQGSVSAIAIDTTITDSTNAPLIYGKFKGYTLQDGEPTPDNPVEINGLAKDGAIEVKTCGKNLFKNTATTQTNKGITFTINNDGSVTANGTATDLAQLWLEDNSLNDRLEVGKTYIATGFSNVGVVADGKTTYTTEFVFTEKTERIVPYIQLASGATVNNETLYPMIRLASIEDDAYQPYTETLAEIDLTEPLYEGDYIEIYADGSGKLVRAMAEVVIDGLNVKLTGADSFRPNGCNYAYLWQDDMSLLNKQASSSIGIGGISPDIEGVRTSDSNTAISIVLYDERTGATSEDTTAERIAKFNTWLQSNPVTVVYELATPQEIELTAEQLAQFKQLRTFEPITNILCDGEVEMRYYKANVNGETVCMLQNIADNSVSKSSIAKNLTTTTEGMVLDATQGKALNDKISTLNYSLENRLSKSLVSTETINIDNLSLSSGGYSTMTSDEISKSGYTLVGAKFFLRGSYAENIIASFTIGGSNTKIYNFAFYNPSDYDISAYGYVDLIYVANSL